ncbi:MAG: PDZ domain-containing protein [Pirellulales bacterium]|nr:PDZ domain-containing protein [Pirellulales bacterium]
MISELWIRRLGWVATVGLVLLSGAWVQAQQPPPPPPPPPHDLPEAGSPFWLGVTCRPADDVLRDQLMLAEGEGLVVVHVAPGSPADKVGLKRHDVLLKAAGQPLHDPRELAAAVLDAGENDASVALTLLRGGKEQTLEVKPAKREMPPLPTGGLDFDDLVRRLQERLGAEGLRIDLPRPGVIVRDVFGTIELPEDVTITVEKHAKDPAKLTVKQGDKTWEVTEDHLAELPEQLRGHAERMLGHMPPLPPDVLQWFADRPEARRVHELADRVRQQSPDEAVRAAEDWLRHHSAAPEVERLIDERLEKINERLEQLQQAIDKLRQEQVAEPQDKPGA